LDYGAIGGVGAGNAVGPGCGGASAVNEEVDDIVACEKILVLELGLDGEFAVFDEDDVFGRGGLLELLISSTSSVSCKWCDCQDTYP
jgi:hypothetical protein